MSRKDFYIIRHGETDYNKEKRWQGCGVNTDLNENGLRQANDLAEKVKNLGIQIIYSSPLKRAVQTAQIVGEKLGIDIKYIENLREGCFGDTEGMLKTEVAEKYPDIFSKWYAPENDMSVSFPKGESKQEMQTRMLTVLNSLLNDEHDIIAIVSHGSSIRYLMMYFGVEMGRMPNTALFHVVYENGCWRAE